MESKNFKKKLLTKIKKKTTGNYKIEKQFSDSKISYFILIFISVLFLTSLIIKHPFNPFTWAAVVPFWLIGNIGSFIFYFSIIFFSFKKIFNSFFKLKRTVVYYWVCTFLFAMSISLFIYAIYERNGSLAHDFNSLLTRFGNSWEDSIAFFTNENLNTNINIFDGQGIIFFCLYFIVRVWAGSVLTITIFFTIFLLSLIWLSKLLFFQNLSGPIKLTKSFIKNQKESNVSSKLAPLETKVINLKISDGNQDNQTKNNQLSFDDNIELSKAKFENVKKVVFKQPPLSKEEKVKKITNLKKLMHIQNYLKKNLHSLSKEKQDYYYQILKKVNKEKTFIFENSKFFKNEMKENLKLSEEANRFNAEKKKSNITKTNIDLTELNRSPISGEYDK